jgi:hypothetical protein
VAGSGAQGDPHVPTHVRAGWGWEAGSRAVEPWAGLPNRWTEGTRWRETCCGEYRAEARMDRRV